MKRATSKLRNFAVRLIKCETAEQKSSEKRNSAAFRILEKFRPNLATLMGSAGFRALIARALVLAIAEVPYLSALQVKADGSLDGLNTLETKVEPAEVTEGAVVLIAHLFALLAAFVGEDLTLHLVCEVWPKLSLKDLDFDNGVEK